MQVIFLPVKSHYKLQALLTEFYVTQNLKCGTFLLLTITLFCFYLKKHILIKTDNYPGLLI